MTKIARISANQVVTLGDFQNLASFPRDALDALIQTAVSGGQSSCYAGATAAKTGTTQVTVEAPMFLYKDGTLYTSAGSNAVLDLLQNLPSSGNRRIAAILLQGETNDTDTQSRDFEVDGSVYPPVMDPQPTATVTHRAVRVAIQLGDQAPSPVRPLVDSANTVVAWVTMSSTEVQTVEQSLVNRINSVRVVDGRLTVIEDWQAQAAPAIEGLKSDVAKLIAASSQKVDRGFQRYLLEQLARLNERVGVDQGASYSYTDYFLNEDDSDVTHLAYTAKVEEGIRFSAEDQSTSALALLTPGDPSIQISPGGMLLPKWSEKVLLSVMGRDAEVALANGGSQTSEYKLKTVSRTRVRYGNSMLTCTNTAWWQTGRYDSVTGIFSREGEQFYVDLDPVQGRDNIMDPAHRLVRVQQIFTDTYEEPYWEATVVPASFTGQVGGNTFLMPRSGWITGFNVGFSRIDAGGGDVRLILCETLPNGAPDYKTALADVTVAHANLKVWPQMTRFPIEPTYCEGGKRYEWHVITPGNHWLAMVENNRYAQGSYFVSTDGVWAQGNISQDACFEVLVADFQTSRLVVNLTNWHLSGGITDIDLLVKKIGKDGLFDIYFEVQVGASWVPLTEVASGNSPLYGLPAALNARMVMLGTQEVMPGIRLNESYVTVSRPRTTAVHVSKARTAPGNVDEVHIVAVLEHYVEANHDCSAKLLVGPGYGTQVSPTATSDLTLPEGSIRRVWTFSGIAPTATWKRRIDIATVSPLSVFLGSELTDVAFPA